MPGNSPWPDEHVELLRRAVVEKQMPVEALIRLFPGRSATAIRCKLRNIGLSCVSDAEAPDMEFFNSYGASSSGLRVV